MYRNMTADDINRQTVLSPLDKDIENIMSAIVDFSDSKFRAINATGAWYAGMGTTDDGAPNKYTTDMMNDFIARGFTAEYNSEHNFVCIGW